MSRIDTPASMGDSQTHSFSVEPDGELIGVGMVARLLDNATRISWSTQRRDLPGGSSGGSSNSGVPTQLPTKSSETWFFEVVTVKDFIVVSCVVASMMLL